MKVPCKCSALPLVFPSLEKTEVLSNATNQVSHYFLLFSLFPFSFRKVWFIIPSLSQRLIVCTRIVAHAAHKLFFELKLVKEGLAFTPCDSFLITYMDVSIHYQRRPDKTKHKSIL